MIEIGFGSFALVLVGNIADNAPEADNLLARFPDVTANMAANFYLRLQKLRLDLIPKQNCSLIQKFGDVRGQFSAIGVNNLILLFNTDG